MLGEVTVNAVLSITVSTVDIFCYFSLYSTKVEKNGIFTLKLTLTASNFDTQYLKK